MTGPVYLYVLFAWLGAGIAIILDRAIADHVFLHAYYAVMVFSAIVYAARSRCDIHQMICLVLLGGYAIENTAALWFDDTGILFLLYLIIAVLLYRYCEVKNSNINKLLLLLVVGKAVAGLVSYSLDIPDFYRHTALNGISIVQWVWFISSSQDRKVLIEHEPKKYDPSYYLRVAAWLSMIPETSKSRYRKG